jgi:hypothetical protein
VSLGCSGSGTPKTTGVTAEDTVVVGTDAIDVTSAAAAPTRVAAATPVVRDFRLTNVLSFRPTET